MKNLSLAWTLIASLFCSLSVTDALHDAGRSLQLAAVGNPTGVERSLAAVALRMGVAPQPAVVPVAVKAPAVQTSLPSTPDKVRDVAKWVLHGDSQASADLVAGDAARLLGLNNGADVNVSTVKLQNSQANVTIYFAIIPGRSEVVLVRKDPSFDRTVYWLVSDGQVVSTVQRLKGVVSVASMERFQRDAATIIDLFYSRLPASGVAAAGDRPRS